MLYKLLLQNNTENHALLISMAQLIDGLNKIKIIQSERTYL